MADSIDQFNDLQELGINVNENEDSLTKSFNKAAEHLQEILPNVDGKILLKLYGYYKQGNEGHCNIPKPSWYDMKAKSKWEAWNKLGSMPQNEAKFLYIETIKSLNPNFNCDPNSTSEDKWIKVSSMLAEVVPSGEKTPVDYIKEGNVKAILNILSEGFTKLNALDAEGMTLIHWAADSGFKDIIAILLDAGADINIQDTDGQTPLHYASFCGHVECIHFLLQKGAKLDILDHEGNSPQDVANNDFVKELFSNYILDIVA